MRILIDTHILIWHLEDDERLSVCHGDVIANAENSIFVSVASLWEIAIKTSRGKLSLSRPIEEVFREIDGSTVSILSIEPRHTLRVASLPFHHRDPFDRLIIAQALTENLSVITVDGDFAAYAVNVI
jgi:PIN domain nuclease of toxin-antitoxin system